jgi:TatD DNase family protein
VTNFRVRPMLIDSHCHLDFTDFAANRDAIVERARLAGIVRMITISTRVDCFRDVSALAEAYPEVFCTVGVHPDHVLEEPDVTAGRLVDLARHPKCVGIGETGLDYHYDKVPRDIARDMFRTHIEAARRGGLPLVVHARDADEDVATILREEMTKGPFKAVLHCFTASRELAEAALELGIFISFSGIITFKKSDALREIARDIPLDRLLIETDAPFLAPVPHRGKCNEPAFVAATAKILAELKNVSQDVLAAITTENALFLFDKIQPPTEIDRVAA